MTPGPMDFGGPMNSKEAHQNFGEDLFFWRSPNFDQKKTVRISRKTFFFGDHVIIWNKLQFTKPEIRHISAGPGPTFGSRRP